MSTSQLAVRVREDRFEGRCEACREWWPLEPEFWKPANGLRRCRACWAEYHRLKERGRTADEIVAEEKRAAARARYAANREQYMARNRAWKAANPDKVLAYRRKTYAKNREKRAAEARVYYWECRDAILLKKRAAS